MIEEFYKVRGKAWTLERYPQYGNTTLRAWSAADEFLVDSVQLKTRNKPLRVLVLNDTYGAVAIPFHDQRTTVMVDSYLSEVAIRRNMKLNRIPEEEIQFLSSVDEIQQKFDLLLINMPASFSLLEYQLQRVRGHLQSKCGVFAVAMSKDANNELYNILQQNLGPTSGPTVPSRKKARLFQIELDADTRRYMKDVPLRSYKIADPDAEIVCAPGVFSADRLDEGTRLLLEHIPSSKTPIDIADYGSGSGVLGLVALMQSPRSSLLLIDESRLAIHSSRETFRRNNLDSDRVTYRLANGFVGTAPESLDLVLSHPEITQDDLFHPWMGHQFIQHSHAVLRPGGSLLFVTQKRHPILPIVEQIFPSSTIVEEDDVYRVISAQKAKK